MKHFRFILTFLILFNLGLTLGADVFQKIEHSSPGSHQERSDVSCLDCETEHDQEACADPCHVGFCHLGHSPVTLTSSDVSYLTSSNNLDHGSSHYLPFDGPVIEGPRQPPRHS